MTAEAGGFALSGEPVSSGATHAAANGNYTLTLAEGTWTATFAPESMDVPFGASGRSVALGQLEAGGYGIDGEAIESGYTHTAANGVQQKIELVRLKDEHPEAFEESKAYEQDAVERASPFTWCQGESLEELEQPERIAQIQTDHERRVARMRAKAQPNPLRSDSEPLDIDDLHGRAKVCLACHKWRIRSVSGARARPRES